MNIRYSKIRLILMGIGILLPIFLMPNIVLAHPGNTAADGCHYCRTNCDKWGVPWNERHCHNGGVATTPKTPTPTPIIWQSNSVPSPTPSLTPTPTPVPSLSTPVTPIQSGNVAGTGTPSQNSSRDWWIVFVVIAITIGITVLAIWVLSKIIGLFRK